MTRLILDVASYQGSLKPADVKRAGFSAVNLKVSHGVTRKSVHPNIAGWVEQARVLGLGISTFHYFTADIGGAQQAEYALERIRELGLADGTMHQLDVECTPKPPLSSVRAYLVQMTAALGRPVALYTGDWWWPAGWSVSDLTPHVWSAPNAGYLGAYPGDRSAHWLAGYGGWPNLAVMQYGVGTLSYPDGTRGTIDVSKSAIRDEAVWIAMTTKIGLPTGKAGAMSTAPQTLKDARQVFLDEIPGMQVVSMGIVGDTPHVKGGDSYHLGKDQLSDSASYSVTESSRDSRPTNAASGLDIGNFSITRQGKTHTLRTFSRWLVAQCQAGASDTKDIREVIYSPDGQVVKRWDRLGKRSTGDSSHLEHTHVSRFRDAENSGALTRLFERYFTEINTPPEDDMPTANEIADAVIAKLKTDAGTAALYAGVNQDKVQAYTTDPATGVQTVRTPTATDNGFMTWASALAFSVRNGDFARVSITSLHRKMEALLDAVELLAKNVAAGEGADAADRDAVLAAISAAKAEILAELEEPAT